MFEKDHPNMLLCSSVSSSGAQHSSSVGVYSAPLVNRKSSEGCFTNEEEVFQSEEKYDDNDDDYLPTNYLNYEASLLQFRYSEAKLSCLSTYSNKHPVSFKEFKSQDDQCMSGSFQGTTSYCEEKTTVFTPNVRQDIYNVCLNPNHPYAEDQFVSDDELAGEIPFGVAVIARACSAPDEEEEFIFVDRNDVPNLLSSLPYAFSLLDDADMLGIIANMGQNNSNACTRAFRMYLRAKAQEWTEKEVSALSVEFVVAFGEELTPRLDIH